MTDDEKKEAYLEAKILERLDHSNIIKFVEVFITRKNRYTLNIVMDYADGILIFYIRRRSSIKNKRTKRKTFLRKLNFGLVHPDMFGH